MTTEILEANWKTSVVSQLYVAWVTSPEGEEKIVNLIQDALNKAQKKSGTLLPSLSSLKAEKDGLSGSQLSFPPSSDSQGSKISESKTTRPRKPFDTASAGKGTVGPKTTQFVVSPLREDSPSSGQRSRLSWSATGNLFAGTSTHADPLRLRTSNALASLEDIPPFYSKNLSQGILSSTDQKELLLLEELLAEYKEGHTSITKGSFGNITRDVFKIPLWMQNFLFDQIVERSKVKGSSSSSSEELTPLQVSEFFKMSCANLTQTRRLFEIIKRDPSRNYITLEDLKEMAFYLAVEHPSLDFLAQPEFRESYARSVAIRIMYALEHQQANKIFWQDFNRSSLPDSLHQLDFKDVNEMLEYFSYEHFYVLYCKFWELDTDRDLHVSYIDLCNYGQGMITPLVIRRVVDGYGRALSSGSKDFLDFEDFIYFCLSEEDKNSQAAVYYWFKVLDLDADGVLSGYELATFFARENQQRLESYFEWEKVPSYENMMCQMLDMLGVDPQRLKKHNGGLTLADFRACPTPANFFNMIFNASKFSMFEYRDPFFELQQRQGREKTDWDRFARTEYDRMASELQY